MIQLEDEELNEVYCRQTMTKFAGQGAVVLEFANEEMQELSGMMRASLEGFLDLAQQGTLVEDFLGKLELRSHFPGGGE